MSFNLGNNDRMPAIGSGTTPSRNNPLRQAVDPSNNRGADMVLTPDHPSWHGAASRSDQHNITDQEPDTAHTSGHAGTLNRGPFHSEPPSRTPLASEAYLPPDAAPQGARFDPIVPDSVRGEFFTGTGAGGGGTRTRYQSGEPDFDDLLPPHGRPQGP